MIAALTVEDFPEFFKEIHSYPPFPWQTRLLKQVAEQGWPRVLDLPTASGKTAALDVAVFHLALEADRGCMRRSPVRITFVVDRRLVVDNAFARAEKIAKALADAKENTLTAHVAERLRLLAGKNAPPMLARRLRGGIPREDSWARTPSQPTILCSTVDQVGSRLLFRGYGVSDRMKPVHAGLIGADCLILLDEAHLSEPFHQTLEWLERYKSEDWREDRSVAAPWGLALLTATPGKSSVNTFSLEKNDRENEILAKRLNASKPARLVEVSKSKDAGESAIPDEEEEADKKAKDKRLVSALVKETLDGLEALQKSQGEDGHPALAVVVNRVARARAVFEDLRKRLAANTADLVLLIGPSRPVEKDDRARELMPIYTGVNPRSQAKPLVVVATQCIEVGVDIDLDGLITETAPIDALRQRFGRLNRGGREIEPYAVIVGEKTRDKDPVYGEAANETWKYLIDNPDEPASKKEKKDARVDFGIAAFEKRIAALSSDYDMYKELLSSKQDAPVLLPAHLDLLSQTSPVPAADPDVSLYLHGADRASDSVSVVWRADIGPEFREIMDVRQLLMLMPPRAVEAIELPLWTVRQWLTGQKARLFALADIPALGLDEDSSRRNGKKQMVFRWAGDDDRSAWIDPYQIKPGDTIVIPASFGGIDEYGWNPDSSKPAADVADKAAVSFEGRRFAVRVATGLLGENSDEEALANAIAANGTANWRVLRDAVMESISSIEQKELLKKLDRARRKPQVYLDLYGEDEDGHPRGVVFLAPFGLKDHEEGVSHSPDTTEDDVAGSLPGFTLPLERHCLDVEQTAGDFARLAGLPADRILDLELAGYLHDSGKADARFQEWLAYGDPLGPDPDRTEEILAKSARPLPRTAREQSKLPKHWRHEALSVRLAPQIPRFKAEAKDPELVLWLIGTHHGHGRPFFPHSDPEEQKTHTDLPNVLGIPSTVPPGHGPQSLAYDWNGLDWPGLYERLKTRYGVWELARMEAILRLADHRASEDAERRARDRKTEDL